jgi:cytidyltransferase-like protein
MKTALPKIGLFFGSFNPVHVGHMVIANYMATQTELDEVWLVISPTTRSNLKKAWPMTTTGFISYSWPSATT